MATLAFVVVRFFVASSDPEGPSAAGLSGRPTQRVVAPIRTVEARQAEAARPVPSTEGELLELLRRDRSVSFGGADAASAPEQEFSLEEVEVIVVDGGERRQAAASASGEPSASGKPSASGGK